MGQGFDLGHGHAAVQVGAHVVRLGRRRVVHIAADVAVAVFGQDLGIRHAARVGRHVLPGAEHVHDLVDVFRPQVVLCLPFAVFAVGVDEQGVVARRAACLVQHQDAGRDAGAVEQVGRQPDHRFEHTTFQKQATHLALFATPEQHAVRHHGSQLAVGLEGGQHVLHEHQVGLLALLGQPHREAARELDLLLDVILAEGRVGQHAVEAPELAVLFQVLGLAQGVLLTDVGIRDAVQQHVHLADGPGGAHLFLPVQRHLLRAAPMLAQVVAHLDEHAARAAGGVVDAHVLLRVAHLHAHAHHFGRGIELTRLLAGLVGKVLQQVFVGRAQQVWELEVLVLQRNLVEVLDEIDEGVVVQRGLPDLAVEVDRAFQHVLQRVGVGIFQRLQRLVEHGADVLLDVLERGLPLAVFVGPFLAPAGSRRHVEVLA